MQGPANYFFHALKWACSFLLPLRLFNKQKHCNNRIPRFTKKQVPCFYLILKQWFSTRCAMGLSPVCYRNFVLFFQYFFGIMYTLYKLYIQFRADIFKYCITFSQTMSYMFKNTYIKLIIFWCVTELLLHLILCCRNAVETKKLRTRELLCCCLNYQINFIWNLKLLQTKTAWCNRCQS